MLQATYPLDTLRLRLAVDPASRSVAGAARALMREGSHRAFFRGLGASMMGLLPSPCCSAWHLPAHTSERLTQHQNALHLSADTFNWLTQHRDMKYVWILDAVANLYDQGSIWGTHEVHADHQCT